MDALRKSYTDPQFFFKPGESGEMLTIIECLRCRKEIKPGDYTQYSMANVFMSFLQCTPNPFIPIDLLKGWNQKEVDAMSFISTIPEPNKSTLHLLVAFLMEVIKKFPTIEVDQLAQLFGGIMTKYDQTVSETATELFKALLK